ncbi:MAG: hypothetical protein FWF53_12260 [Candidatus Azobacteroides sp.]|nr:hypothetical protein [Candidatus Azobacteroides sp.]
MKRSSFHRISTGVLWLCTLISLILAVWFYSVCFTQTPDPDTESTEISALLYWLFILFIITVCTGLIFSFFYFIRRWHENPKKIRRSAAVAPAGGFLLLIAWVSGNGNPLPLVGYKGNENTYLWLKLTDMWLYSIYILLGLAFFALLGGIIWSYFKKVN